MSDACHIPEELDVLPLLGTVVYPLTVTPLAVRQPATVRMLERADGSPPLVVAVALRGAARWPEPLHPADCFSVGTAALVHRLLRLPDDTLRVALQALRRVELVEFLSAEPPLRARVRPLSDAPEDPAGLAAMAGRVRDLVAEAGRRAPGFNPELLRQVAEEEDPHCLAYLAATALVRRPLAERQALLELPTTAARLDHLAALLAAELRLFQRGAQAEEPAAAPSTAASPSGLAWLRWGSSGPQPAPVEVVALPGRGALTRTGQRGAALHDAALLALTWVRSAAAALGLAPDFPGQTDLHLHIAPGAAPADGATAGLPIAIALVAALAGRPAPPGVALAGELALDGRVLPVGRARERALAARWAGIATLVLPAANADDLAGLPATPGAELRLLFVERAAEAVAAVLGMGGVG